MDANVAIAREKMGRLFRVSGVLVLGKFVYAINTSRLC